MILLPASVNIHAPSGGYSDSEDACTIIVDEAIYSACISVNCCIITGVICFMESLKKVIFYIGGQVKGFCGNTLNPILSLSCSSRNISSGDIRNM